MSSVVVWYLSFTMLVFLNVWFFIVLKIPCLLVYGCHFCLSQPPMSVEYRWRVCWWIRYIVSLSSEWERIHPAWPLQPKDQSSLPYLLSSVAQHNQGGEKKPSGVATLNVVPPALWKFPRTLSLLVSIYSRLYFFFSFSFFLPSFSPSPPFLSLSIHPFIYYVLVAMIHWALWIY